MGIHIPAIVLSHGPGGLGAVRSLARRGVKVIAIAYEESDPVRHSRYPSEVITIKGIDDDKREINLLNILRQLPYQGAAILTTSDRLVTFISNYREEMLLRFRFQLPSKGVLDALNDKSREVDLICSLGFPVPKTIKNLPPRPEMLERELRYPIIIKPYSVFVKKLFLKKNLVVTNHQEMVKFYTDWEHALHVVLAQEVIAGPDSYSWVCSCTYDQNYNLLDCLVRQKLRTIPAHFGTSTYSVCRNNSKVLELARKLGKQLRYVGHAGIEFRWDERDNQYKYIELNPRIPGEVGFDAACGLPTVWNSYKVALGDSVTSSGIQQKEGIYFIDLKRDIISLLTDHTPIYRIFKNYLILLFKKTCGLYFEWGDPMPGIFDTHRFFAKGGQWIFRKLER